MQLYFSPLACSMATRIALYEAGLEADYQHVDHVSRRAPDGTDIRTLHPLGYVPTLRTDDGLVLTENAAILQYVATWSRSAALAPADERGRAALQQWLSFIGTELHKAVFIPLLDRTAPDGAKAYALANAETRLPALARHLAGRTYVLDTFSIADAYLFTVLNWAQAAPIRLDRYPELVAYMSRLRARAAVARAVALETELFIAERGRPTPPPPPTRAVIDRFNDVFQNHEPSALAELVADDCTIENTDGGHHAGKAACIALWSAIATDPEIAFELEDVVVTGERATILWRLQRGAEATRGVNLMTIAGGRIASARGYIKPA